VTVNIREQIKLLVAAQDLDAQIYSLTKEKDLLPAEVARIKKEFEDKKSHLNSLDEKSKSLATKRKEKELDVATKEEGIKKFTGQLSILKTNKEYSAMMEQIASLKTDNSLIEEDILRIMDEQDVVREELNKEKVVLVEEEKRSKVEEKKSEDRIKEIEQNIADLSFKRRQAVEPVDKNLLADYERILKAKNGLALVKVEHSACRGCFINVTSQIINEIKMRDKVIHCDACARMLYLEEDL